MRLTFNVDKYNRLAEAHQQRLDARRGLSDRVHDANDSVRKARETLERLQRWTGTRDLDAEKRAEAALQAEADVLGRLKADQQQAEAAFVTAARLFDSCREFLRANGVRVDEGRVPHGNLSGASPSGSGEQLLAAMRFPNAPPGTAAAYLRRQR